MAVSRWCDQTWEDVRDLARKNVVVILPLGALEAHGPQLPLSTDVIIAEAMAESAAAKLAARGIDVLLLPSLPYSAAPFASAFPGTISMSAETVTALLVDIARSLARQEVRWLAIANAHLDPAHLSSIHAAVKRVAAEGDLAVIFPDLTAKPWALRLGDEFRSGACHAGRFESSIVMAAEPRLVRDDVRRSLPPVPSSLSRAIREGKADFVAAGGPRAYFGAPAEANREEGEQTIAVLGGILEEAVMAGMTEAR